LGAQQSGGREDSHFGQRLENIEEGTKDKKHFYLLKNLTNHLIAKISPKDIYLITSGCRILILLLTVLTAPMSAPQQGLMCISSHKANVHTGCPEETSLGHPEDVEKAAQDSGTQPEQLQGLSRTTKPSTVS
jgi:hypothetical protein